MDVIVLVAVLSCLNSGIYVASRIMFTLAGRGDAPRWIVQVDKRGVPSRAILIGAAIALAAVALEAFFPKDLFGFLISASGALMIFVYMPVVMAHLILRPKTPPEQLKLKTWFYPWSGYIVLAAMLAVLVAMSLQPGSRYELIASTTCLVVVVIAYFVLRKRRPA
jgi:L-asparagine transporter-like permease